MNRLKESLSALKTLVRVSSLSFHRIIRRSDNNILYNGDNNSLFHGRSWRVIFWKVVRRPRSSLNKFLNNLMNKRNIKHINIQMFKWPWPLTFMSFCLAEVEASIPNGLMSLRGKVKSCKCFYWMTETYRGNKCGRGLLSYSV